MQHCGAPPFVNVCSCPSPPSVVISPSNLARACDRYGPDFEQFLEEGHNAKPTSTRRRKKCRPSSSTSPTSNNNNKNSINTIPPSASPTSNNNNNGRPVHHTSEYPFFFFKFAHIPVICDVSCTPAPRGAACQMRIESKNKII